MKNLITLLPPTEERVFHYLLSTISSRDAKTVLPDAKIACPKRLLHIEISYRGSAKHVRQLASKGFVKLSSLTDENPEIYVGYKSTNGEIQLYYNLLNNPLRAMMALYLSALPTKLEFIQSEVDAAIEAKNSERFFAAAQKLIYQLPLVRHVFLAKEKAQFKKLDSLFPGNWELTAQIIFQYLTTTSHKVPTIGAVLSQKDNLLSQLRSAISEAEVLKDNNDERF